MIAAMNPRRIRHLLAHVRDGRLERRAFIERMVALGVGAPLASLLLADVSSAQAPAAFAYKGTRRGGGGALKLLLWQGPTLLNPHFASGSKDQEGSRPFYEPLARYDVDGRLEPVLAAEIPSRQNGGIAADGLSTVWTLKKDVRWHDGAPFGADDVVFNWQFAVDPATGAFTPGSYAGIKAIEKVDAHTVRIVFDRPTPSWSRSAPVQLIPRHLFAAHQGARSRDAPNNLKPVGTGPYRFVEFKPGDLVRGELNPTYHMANRPFFDSIEIKGGGDATSAARAVLQTGEYDYAWNVLVEDEVLKRMESAGKGRVVFNPTGTTEFIMLNAADPNAEVDGERAHPKSRHPVLSQPAVRRALALLLDRRAIQEFVYGRAGLATPNILNNPAPFNSPNLKMDFSVDKANAVLDEAGWKRGSDGIREKDGRKLRFLYQTSTNSVRQKVQAIYKQSCGRAGIELEIKTVTPAVFFSSDVANPDTNGKFWADLQMFAFTRIPDPDRFLQQFVSWEMASKANKWQGLNQTRWSNDEYDRLFRASEVELDPVKRAALCIRMNDIVCGDGHILPVVIRPDVAALGRSIVAPLSGWDIGLAGLHDWYRTG
jgi:peptide/nickel transport system substrate-binding protein